MRISDGLCRKYAIQLQVMQKFVMHIKAVAHSMNVDDAVVQKIYPLVYLKNANEYVRYHHYFLIYPIVFV